MGHSEYDPAAKERRPWNAGRMVGAKRGLKPHQVWAIHRLVADPVRVLTPPLPSISPQSPPVVSPTLGNGQLLRNGGRSGSRFRLPVLRALSTASPSQPETALPGRSGDYDHLPPGRVVPN